MSERSHNLKISSAKPYGYLWVPFSSVDALTLFLPSWEERMTMLAELNEARVSMPRIVLDRLLEAE